MTNKNIVFFCTNTNRGKSILKSVDQKFDSSFSRTFATRCASSKKCSTDFYQSFTSVCLWWSSNVLIRVV